MSRQCAQCRQPLGEFELSLKCANPRCTSLCHSSCASGPLLLNDGGRVPRWRCSSCQLLSPANGSSYESVYGRPRSGDTLKRIKDDWAINRTIDALHLQGGNRGHFDRGSNYRASTGAILGRQRPTDLNFSLPVRPKSVILTPTPTEDTEDIIPQKKDMEPKKDSPSTQNPVPYRIVTPDEKYDETVKSFYKWLEEHECASKDKSGNRGGLVKDKIAQFGAKLEDHLASRTADKREIGRVKVQHPVPKSGTKWGASHDTWPKTQATKHLVNQDVVNTNDPLEGRYYSGKLIEAEKGDTNFGTSRSLLSDVYRQPTRPDIQRTPEKPTIKQHDSGYSGVYANQHDLGITSNSYREKSPVGGVHQIRASTYQPVQPSMMKTGSINANMQHPHTKSVIDQAVYSNQPELQNTAIGREQSSVTGFKRHDTIHESSGSKAINNPMQSSTSHQIPYNSNVKFDATNSKRNDGDYGAVYTNPRKTDRAVRPQEKYFAGGVQRVVDKPPNDGSSAGYNKGGLDDERIYNNTTPVGQRGIQVTELSSLKPIFGRPKSSSTRRVEVSDDEVSQDEDDFPPPPPCLETDLDQLEIHQEVKSANSAGESSEDAMVGRKSFDVLAKEDRRGLSVGQEVHEDARIVKHAVLPARGTFTLSIVNTSDDNQVNIIRSLYAKKGTI